MKLSAISRLSLPAQFGIFLACLLPLLWAFIFLNLQRLHHQITVDSRVQTHNLVRAFAEEVKSSVNSIDFALIELRDEWFDPEKNFLYEVQKRQAYLEENVGFQVAIIDALGMLAYSSSDPEAKPIDLSDREHFRVHSQRDGDRLFISKPIFGRVSQRWTIQFTRPLHNRDGEFAGVIVLSVAPEYFSRFYTTLDLGPDNSIALIRKSGEILARSPNPELAMGKSVDDFSFLHKPSSQSGLFEKSSQIDGMPRLYGWRILPKGDLAVMVGRSLAGIYAPYEEQRKFYVLGGTVVSLVIGTIAFFLLLGLQRLQAEQRRVQVILENSHDAFVAIDSNGLITDWNSKAEATFGWSAAEAIGKQLGNLIIPEEMRQKHEAGFQQFVSKEKNSLMDQVIEVEAVHRSGKRIPIELAIAGFYDGKGYAANAFMRDISERKEAERINLEHALALDDTRKALQHSQKLEALGRLTGGIAHDFNNVLQTLSTGIQLALYTATEKSVVSALGACDRAVNRGVELVRQLSVFGRVQEVNLKTVDPAGQIQAMVPLLRGALPSNIKFDLNLHEPLWPVKIDAMQFELALLNLAMNARDAMPDGGHFTIEGSNEALSHPTNDLAPGDYVRLVITDTGEGMSAEVLARALDPFFTTKPIGKGSGMGLSQVYGFAKQMRGTLLLRSRPGAGLQVSMYLPREKEEVPAAQAEKSSSCPKQPTFKSTILFVEDDELVMNTVRPALEEYGFNVVTAENGDEALALLETGKQFDLIFSDIVMPGQISGIELANIVHSRFPELRIILATGYSDRAIGLPNIQTLSKPYEITTLVNSVAEELNIETAK